MREQTSSVKLQPISHLAVEIARTGSKLKLNCNNTRRHLVTLSYSYLRAGVDAITAHNEVCRQRRANSDTGIKRGLFYFCRCSNEQLEQLTLQCFDAVGWAAGRASGL